MIKITYANDFEAAARSVAKNMTGNVAGLDDRSGMVLVRDGTPEADERQKKPGMLMIPFEAEGRRYWICSR
jgi:hypothetical protein